MPKRKGIFLCSVLKPIDEPRMWSRMVKSIRKATDEPIYLFGQQPNKELTGINNLTCYAQTNFKRLSIIRVFSSYLLFKKLLKVKPNIIILNTHELLIVTCFYRILFGGKIIYDIQENYYKNIRYSDAFISPLRLLIASYVRAKEVILAPSISHFILAEQCYRQELKFVKKRHTILENKFAGHENKELKRNTTGIQFLFSGTLAKESGVFESINLIKRFHSLNKNVSLVIIGHTPKTSILREIESEIKDAPFISLKGGSRPVSHNSIIESIQKANIGILAYQERRHTENRIPTKLYEYQALGLAILSQAKRTWNSQLVRGSSIITDLSDCHIQGTLNDCISLSQKTVQPLESSFWTVEEERLNSLLINHLK